MAPGLVQAAFGAEFSYMPRMPLAILTGALRGAPLAVAPSICLASYNRCEKISACDRRRAIICRLHKTDTDLSFAMANVSQVDVIIL